MLADQSRIQSKLSVQARTTTERTIKWTLQAELQRKSLILPVSSCWASANLALIIMMIAMNVTIIIAERAAI